MTEASNATNSAVSLSLWCAAVEAMVVPKSHETTQAFAANPTTLLQPDAELRIAAMKNMKKLYAARSDLIHGNSIEKDEDRLDQARLVASGVFRALMQWMREHDAIDQKLPSEDAFFDALQMAAVTGKPMNGVSPLLARSLPGHSTRQAKGSA
jgi:hypothetical protein